MLQTAKRLEAAKNSKKTMIETVVETKCEIRGIVEFIECANTECKNQVLQRVDSDLESRYIAVKEPIG